MLYAKQKTVKVYNQIFLEKANDLREKGKWLWGSLVIRR